jgi:hypothetical protein
VNWQPLFPNRDPRGPSDPLTDQLLRRRTIDRSHWAAVRRSVQELCARGCPGTTSRAQGRTGGIASTTCPTRPLAAMRPRTIYWLLALLLLQSDAHLGERTSSTLKFSMQHKCNWQEIGPAGRRIEFPIRLNPTRRKTCEHRWARSFGIDDIPVFNGNPDFNVPSDVQLRSRRRVRRARAAKQEARAWTTISGTAGCTRRTTLC